MKLSDSTTTVQPSGENVSRLCHWIKLIRSLNNRGQKEMHSQIGKDCDHYLLTFVVVYFCVSDESTDSADEGGEEEEEEEEDPDVKEAVNELVPDLAAEDDEAHLNLSLEEEYSIIAEYRALILLAGYDASSLASKS